MSGSASSARGFSSRGYLLEFDRSCNGLIGIRITAFVPSSGFETNRLADTLCLLAKRLQLRLYEFGLNSNNVIEILSMTQLLNEFVCDSEIFLGKSF
jgi:hypothetical protein